MEGRRFCLDGKRYIVMPDVPDTCTYCAFYTRVDGEGKCTDDTGAINCVENNIFAIRDTKQGRGAYAAARARRKLGVKENA